MNSKTHEKNTPQLTKPELEAAEVGQDSEPSRDGKAAVTAAIWGRLKRGSVLCQK